MKKFIPTLPEIFVWAAIFLLLWGLCYQPPAAEAIRNGNSGRKHGVISQSTNK